MPSIRSFRFWSQRSNRNSSLVTQVNKIEATQLPDVSHSLPASAFSLPTELLLAIFDLAVIDDNNFPAVAVVTCKRWRAVILGHPRIWSYIWLGAYLPYQKFQLWQKRRGTLNIPLSVTIALRTAPDLPVHQQPYQSKEWINLLELFARRNFLIGSFHFDGDAECLDNLNMKMGGYQSEQIIVHLDASPIPHVAASTFSLAMAPVVHPPSFPSPQEGVPDPKVISLRGTMINFSPTSTYTSVTILELMNVPHDSRPPISAYIPLLRRMPELQTLAIHYSESDLPTPFFSSTTFERSHTRCPASRLFLRGDFPVRAFLKSISFPNLESLFLQEIPDNVASLLPFVGLQSQRLRNLCVAQSSVQRQMPHEAFPLFRSLTHLYFIQTSLQKIPSSFIEAVSGHHDWLPRLQEFTLYHSLGSHQRYSAQLCDESGELSVIALEDCKESDIPIMLSSIYLQLMGRPMQSNCRRPPESDGRQVDKSRLAQVKRRAIQMLGGP
ncbi:hypothetical protein SISSUDRAFT_124672 [Sistotremastrum suecicum HHB10207 ss-3]|uniref:Uncharacterized protein n=1 Tax=Sistotremastrum suecicum HHB10207 ss-3 TaxID=1314776 RepID=A0A166B0K1_9AGAM|nr:hypothetical protein SISSUDRAFT_124672 [Sistotremastrum suecicum HHB10207 ss-3]